MEKLYDIQPGSKVFYYSMAGRHAYTGTLIATLTRPVQLHALHQAVKNAMIAQPYYQSHPVKKGNDIFVVRRPPGQVPVFEETNSGRAYGSDETYGYLFYVTYCGRDIYLRTYHGLADGRGMFLFLQKLLEYYFKELGFDVKTGDSTMDPEELDSHDAFAEFLKLTEGLEPFGQYEAKDVFVLPEHLYPDECCEYRLLEIETALSPMLAMSKRFETSPVPLMQALVGEAIHKVYDVGKRPVVAYTPIDLRGRIGLESGGNASTAVKVPYYPRMGEMDLEFRSSALRASLELQAQMENLRLYAAGTYNLVQGLQGKDVPPETIYAAMSGQITQGFRKGNTYLISYVGQTPVDEAIVSQVEAIRVYADPYNVPLSIDVVEHKGVMRLSFATFFDDTRVVEEIFERIRTSISWTHLLDRGMVREDSLDLGTLEQVE